MVYKSFSCSVFTQNVFNSLIYPTFFSAERQFMRLKKSKAFGKHKCGLLHGQVWAHQHDLFTFHIPYLSRMSWEKAAFTPPLR